MTLRLGDKVPDFQAPTTEGDPSFHDWLGDSWGVLFAHPADFTPVCTTELGTVARLKPEFERRNVKVIGLSVDPLDSHRDWIEDINEKQSTTVNFPVVPDGDRQVAELYDMIHPDSDDETPVRSVFVIDPRKTLRLSLTYPPAAGRNFGEILRVIDSLQLTTYQKVATPADWQQGEDVVILPTVTDEEARELFPDGFTTHRPYLRTTAQPRNLLWPRPTKVGSRAGALEEDATAVEGSWALTMKTPMGEREVTLDATEDDGSFSGMHSGQQRSSEISDGTIDGSTVPWQVTIDAPMGQMVLSFSGSIDGDSISGDVQSGSFGSGTFAGKRA